MRLHCTVVVPIAMIMAQPMITISTLERCYINSLLRVHIGFLLEASETTLISLDTVALLRSVLEGERMLCVTDRIRTGNKWVCVGTPVVLGKDARIKKFCAMSISRSN